MVHAETHWIVEGPDESKQPRYFRAILTSECKFGKCIAKGESCAFASTGCKKLSIPSKLIKIRFDWGETS